MYKQENIHILHYFTCEVCNKDMIDANIRKVHVCDSCVTLLKRFDGGGYTHKQGRGGPGRSKALALCIIVTIISSSIGAIPNILDAQALTWEMAQWDLDRAYREQRYNEILQDLEIIGEIEQQAGLENAQAETNATHEQQPQVTEFREKKAQPTQEHISPEQFQQQFNALNKTMGLS